MNENDTSYQDTPENWLRNSRTRKQFYYRKNSNLCGYIKKIVYLYLDDYVRALTDNKHETLVRC